MSLHGTINVNGKAIAVWEAKRVEPLGTTTNDTVCTYHWLYVDLQDGGQAKGTVEHRYGDGAPKLLARVMRALGG